MLDETEVFPLMFSALTVYFYVCGGCFSHSFVLHLAHDARLMEERVEVSVCVDK